MTQISFFHYSVNSTNHTGSDFFKSDLCYFHTWYIFSFFSHPEQSYQNSRHFYVTLDWHSSQFCVGESQPVVKSSPWHLKLLDKICFGDNFNVTVPSLLAPTPHPHTPLYRCSSRCSTKETHHFKMCLFFLIVNLIIVCSRIRAVRQLINETVPIWVYFCITAELRRFFRTCRSVQDISKYLRY